MGCGSSKQVDETPANSRPVGSGTQANATTTQDQRQQDAGYEMGNQASSNQGQRGTGYETRNQGTSNQDDPPNPIVYFDISQGGK
jgi:hypothetical protein